MKTTDSDNDGKLSFTEFSKAVSVDLLKLVDGDVKVMIMMI